MGVSEAVQERWDALLERIRAWPRPRPAEAQRLLSQFVEETGMDPSLLDDMRERLEMYQAIARGDFETSEEYREARANAWQEFLDALDEVELELG